MPEQKLKPIIKASYYMHISNSGATISVIDEGFGPCIEVHSSTFGNLKHSFQIATSKDDLAALGRLFLQAASEDYTEQYCHAALGLNGLQEKRQRQAEALNKMLGRQ